MALLVWLPLINNIENKGVADVVTSNIGTVSFNSTGKIGAGSFKSGNEGSTTSNDGVSINSNFVDIFGDTASVSAWVMPLGEHGHYNGTIVTSGNWNGKKWAFGVSKDNTKVDVLCGNYNTYINCIVPVNEWTHLASTYDHGVSKLYKNGEYVGELTGTQIKSFESDATNTMIGRATYGKYFGFYGNINDVRIYNHVLSAKEIKEISQGLILHYKLDGWLSGATENMGLKSRNFGATAAKTNIDFGNRATSSGDTIVRNDGFNEVSVKTGFGGICIYANSLGLKVGQKYTYSFMAYEIGCTTPNFSLYPMMYNSSGVRDTTTKMPIYVSTATTWSEANARAFGAGNLTATPKRFYCAFEWNQAVQDIIDNGGRIELSIQGHGTLGGGTIHFYAPKLEEGFNKNPDWSPNSADPEVDRTIYDSSGYGNNGTPSNSGLTFSQESIRYSGCTYFDGEYGAITMPTNFKTWVQNPFTMNLWFRKDSVGTKSYESLIGGASGFEMDTRAGSSSTLSLYMASTRGGNVFSPFQFGQWYMVTMVNDGTNEMYYVNGVLSKTITKKSMPNSTYWIGAWSSATKQNYKGFISDFRLYTTVLSASDIKQLYETRASIDNEGDFISAEFVEDGGRELLAVGQTGYHTHRDGFWTQFNKDGEWYFDTTGTSSGSEYIPISPNGKTYYFDITVSKDAGNQVYIGFERYDKDFTPRSNSACVYYVSNKTDAYDHKRFFGTAGIQTDGVNPTAYIRLRILNGWSSTTGTMTIHNMSLREVDTATGVTLQHIIKTGVMTTDEFREGYNQAKFMKNGFTEVNEIIEI